MLKFIGNGSCFNTSFGNNSCYYIDENRNFLLIDCGESIFERLVQYKLLNSINELNIVITHLHSDHAGSLPSLLFYCKYVINIKPNVIYPEKDVIRNYLNLTGNSEDDFNLLSPEEFNKYSLEYISQEHSDKINAFGYLLNINGSTIFYSGDAHTINTDILRKLNSGEIDYFFQDVTIHENTGHLNINSLNEIVSPNFRNRVFCMHLDDESVKSKVESFGFNVSKIIS